jgi:UDP-2-acetamido-3-amino-2,3-dideoxy-glucuronate N-acetyltransferase
MLMSDSNEYFCHPTSIVDEGARIGKGTKIWHFSHVMNAELGAVCILGQNVFIAEGVRIGDNVKIQNNVSVYTGTIIEDDVFLGPSCVLTNVSNPRSQVLRHHLYETTLLRRGCTIGANATIVCGVKIGRYAFIGAGAVVTADVPDYALMLGVPAVQKGWMSRHGHILRAPDAGGVYHCPESGLRYQLAENGSMTCVSIGEEEELPETMRQGLLSYDELKG